jgi:Short C-terminal domain
MVGGVSDLAPRRGGGWLGGELMGAPVGNDLSVLRAKERALAEQNIAPGESVRFCLVGTGNQGFVALDDRLLIVKTGFMAGTSFGGRATSFRYADIAGVQVNTGLVKGTIEVHTAAMGATKASDFWSNDENKDPWKLPNCIPIEKKNLSDYQPYLEDLRLLIQAARSGRPGGNGDGSDLASRLAKLQELRASGALTDEEFAAAKARVLTE